MSISRVKRLVKQNFLLITILIGVIVGITIGLSSHKAVHSSTNPSPKRLAMYIKLPGELFIRMLKMTVIPLVMSSIVVALADNDVMSASRIGKRTVAYYFLTTLLACILGLVVGSIVNPGGGVTDKASSSPSTHRNPLDSFLDMLRNCFPDNIVESFIRSTYTTYKRTESNFRYNTLKFNLENTSAKALAKILNNNRIVPGSVNHSDQTLEVIVSDEEVDFGGTAKGGNTNMIGQICFAIAFGAVLSVIGEEGKPLLAVFKSLYAATMKLVSLVMWLAAFGVGSIIAGNIVEANDITALFRAMGMFVVANLIGFILQGFVVYPLIYLVATRRNPLKLLQQVMPAIVTAFGTRSSAATLPCTTKCCEENAKIDSRVTRFVLPIGATCNMDGTALYYAITVLFIEQVEPNVSLIVGDKILTIIVCTFVSIGTAGVPSPGLSIVIVVLEGVGLPTDKLGPTFAVSWFLGACQTAVNVMGDAYAAAIIARWSGLKSNNLTEISSNSTEKPLHENANETNAIIVSDGEPHFDVGEDLAL